MKKVTAFRSRLSSFQIENSRKSIDVRQFLNSIERIVGGNIRRELTRRNNLKLNIVLFSDYKRVEQYQQMNFKTRNEIITPATNFNQYFAESIQRILNEMETFEIRGNSGY